MTDLKRLRKRADRAFAYRDRWDRILRDVYDYVIPYRNAGVHLARSQERVDAVFDGTAVKAAMRFAGRMQTDFTPVGEPFFALEAGPGFKARFKDQVPELNTWLQGVSASCHAALVGGNFDMAAHEMYTDLFAGTGAMLIGRGDQPGTVHCQSIPIYELGLEVGPNGNLWGRYWRKSFPAEQLPDLWPDGRFGDRLGEMIDKEGDKPVTIMQAVVWNPKARLWELTVYCADQNADDRDARAIFSETYTVSPLITPRFFVVPGETMGRGPAMMALPQIRVVNKTRELALRAAGLALLGVWMRRQDAAFNTDTARFTPGAMIEVTSTGGIMGPALQRLDIPANFDISSFVMNDERENLKMMLLDESLPPESGAVRSATEIMERMKRLNQDLGGVLGRLTYEIIRPVVQRVISILAEDRVIETQVEINHLWNDIRITSPIASSISANKAKSLVDWVTVVQTLVGPDKAIAICKLEEAMPEIGRWMGVDEQFIRSDDEAQTLQALVQNLVAQGVDQALAGMQGGGGADMGGGPVAANGAAI